MSDTGKIIALAKAVGARPDPDDVKQNVDDWLDDHPEATTTVEDGAITKAKLHSDLVDEIEGVENAVSDTTTKTGNPLIFVDSEPHNGTVTAENATLVAVYGNQMFNAGAWSGKTGVSGVSNGVITFDGTNATGSANNIISTPYLPKGQYTVKIEAGDAATKYCRFSLRANDGTVLSDTNA